MGKLGLKWVLTFALCLLAESALAATKNILVVGYWPPTNGILREFSQNPAQNPGGWGGQNWEKSGYDVYAYFPEFPVGAGLVGVGDFRVDFAATYNDFMRVTGKLAPVAIIGFGQGNGPWEIETNLPSGYYSKWFKRGRLPSTIDVRTDYPVPRSLMRNTARSSSLPVDAIAAAVIEHSGINAWVDRRGDAGSYLCGFLGHLAAWYHDEHSSPTDPIQNRGGGFIHVSGSLTNRDAVRATQATLRALIQTLNRN